MGPYGRPADGASEPPALSADGRHFAVVSVAARRVPRDTDGVAVVFVRDRFGD